MSLRVLLADESQSIKKAFQLALHDYAVEVRTVNSGLDVLAAAEDYKPDIIFADVLLQKQSGYEVSNSLKAHQMLKDIPIILMWSEFMEVDDSKYQNSLADDKLEKPFDVNALRSIVEAHVTKVNTQKISKYLDFPKMPEFDLAKPTEATPIGDNSQSMEEASSDIWNMESFDEIKKDNAPAETEVNETEEFQPVQLNQRPSVKPASLEQLSTEWVSKELNEFKVDTNALSNDAFEIETPNIELDQPVAMDSTPMLEDLSIEDSGSDDQLHDLPEFKTPDLPQVAEQKIEPIIDQKQIEDIIRVQAREILEEVIWKVVPEVARTVIEQEIKKILAEEEEQLNPPKS